MPTRGAGRGAYGAIGPIIPALGEAGKNMGLSAISREMTAKTKHDHSFTKFIFTLRVLTRYISENFQCNSRPIQYIASLELCYFPIAKLI